MSEEKKFYPKVLFVGQSGKGKTYSFRNMDRKSTGFINAENKPLPFKGSFDFHGKPSKFDGLIKCMNDYASNPAINVICIDSMSAVFEILVHEAREKYSGWDVWNYYNKKVGEFLNLIKKIEKPVFITAHYELLNTEGEVEKRVKVKGKEWEGVIEKEFTIVLYSQDKYKGEVPEYFFKLAGEGLSAKCPPDVFGAGVYKIDNDTNLVLGKLKEFYEL